MYIYIYAYIFFSLPLYVDVSEAGAEAYIVPLSPRLLGETVPYMYIVYIVIPFFPLRPQYSLPAPANHSHPHAHTLMLEKCTAIFYFLMRSPLSSLCVM